MGFPMNLAYQVFETPPSTAAATKAAAAGNATTAGAPVVAPTTGTGATLPATTVETIGATTKVTAPAEPSGLEALLKSPLPIFLLVIVFFYFFMLRGPRKEEKKRKEALAALKKGDEVLLISGKFGTIVDIRDDYVVVKVDETNNIKEKYLKSAIQKVMVETTEAKKS